MQDLPTLSKDLIDQLDEDYPRRNPKPDDDLISIHRYAAKRELIEDLKTIKQREIHPTPSVNPLTQR